jgi:hypothetical protein
MAQRILMRGGENGLVHGPCRCVDEDVERPALTQVPDGFAPDRLFDRQAREYRHSRATAFGDRAIERRDE